MDNIGTCISCCLRCSSRLCSWIPGETNKVKFLWVVWWFKQTFIPWWNYWYQLNIVSACISYGQAKTVNCIQNPIVLRVSSFSIKALKSRVERQSDVRYMFVSQLNACYFPGFYRLERYKGATNLRNFTNFRTKLGLFFPTSNGFGPGQPDNEGLNTENHAPQVVGF